MSWSEQRRALLEELRNIGGAGRAEGLPNDRIARGYYPVTEHLRLLDPEVVLVVGARGSGKTEVARVLTDAALFDAIKSHAPSVRLPNGTSQWLRVHPTGSEGFEGIGLRAFVQSEGHETEVMRELWLAYLVRSLYPLLGAQEQELLAPLHQLPGAQAQEIYRAFRNLGTQPIVALDHLDQQLEERQHYVFATYDELDTLGNGDWKLIEAGVRGLVALWAAYARRWRHLRAKVFLRTDLYERHAKGGGADLAKLAAGRVELVWNDRELYGLLLKRMANSEQLAAYLEPIQSISWMESPQLGKIPKLQTWQHARPVVERLIGPYMGAGEKKGLVYRWLLDHVRDGLGRAYPRPFVLLMEEAAGQELDHFETLRHPRLLTPTSLRRALDRVSMIHIAQSQDEWLWLDTLKECLRTSPLVPYMEKEAIDILDRLSTENVSPLPPFEGRSLLGYLLELGIFRRRPDQRIDAPDLYLTGLGLRRKGGVAKRR